MPNIFKIIQKIFLVLLFLLFESFEIGVFSSLNLNIYKNKKEIKKKIICIIVVFIIPTPYNFIFVNFPSADLSHLWYKISHFRFRSPPTLILYQISVLVFKYCFLIQLLLFISKPYFLHQNITLYFKFLLFILIHYFLL